MPKDPACGTDPAVPSEGHKLRSFEDLYDDILRVENLVRAARLLSWHVDGLTEDNCPPILFLLDESSDTLRKLSDDLSELERLAKHGRIALCQ